MATAAIGEAAAQDMLELSGESNNSIKTVFVKFRDGPPMAAGVRRVFKNADIKYIISQEKQSNVLNRPELSFFGEDESHIDDQVIYFIDPMNATGNTTSKSLTFLRQKTQYERALISHVAANDVGIKHVQTTLDEFSIEGCMNYAYNSKKLNELGYMDDGLSLTRDFGDKVFGTYGSDYSIFNIQDEMRNVIKTQAGKIELLNGAILHMVQKSGQPPYCESRTAQWMTKDWITASLQWLCAVKEFPFQKVSTQQAHALIDNLYDRDFLVATERPFHKTTEHLYSLTEDGYKYTSAVYIPILKENGLMEKIERNYYFLIELSPEGIRRNIGDKLIWS